MLRLPEARIMNPLHITHKILSTADLVIIGLYCCVVFAIGFYFSRKERSNDILVPHLKLIFDLSYAQVMLVHFASFRATFFFSGRGRGS